MARFWKVCWVGSISVRASWAVTALSGLLEREEGLGHLAGEALVELGGSRATYLSQAAPAAVSWRLPAAV